MLSLHRDDRLVTTGSCCHPSNGTRKQAIVVDRFARMEVIERSFFAG